MRRVAWGVCGAVVLALLGSGAATAQTTASLPIRTTMLAAVAPSTPPVGWLQFCTDHPTECDGPARKPRTIRLSPKAWATLQAVNRAVNEAIEPVSDLEQWGRLEHWSFPTTGKGDCEDYVLEKRRRLANAGFPREALLITVVRDHKGDGHAVLTVRTDRGDFVLDNQEEAILPWSATGYRFVKRQRPDHPNLWEGLGDVDGTIVTANR